MRWGFRSSAVMVDAKDNRRRKWLRLLLIGSAVLVVVGFEIASASPFLQRWIARADAIILRLNVGSDFPSVDRLDSLQWGVIAQKAAGALAERNATIRHVITFLIALLSLALGYLILRSMLEMAASKKNQPLNGSLNHQADKNAAGALFYFTLGEPAASKENYKTSTIDPREYVLGIDLAAEEFTITVRPESEWEL